MSYSQDVSNLVALAESALASAEQKVVDEFVVKTGEYLDALEKWQQAMNQCNPLLEGRELSDGERASFRAQIEKLGDLHQRLLNDAGSTKDDVGTKMSDVHKRAAGLRKYIDSAPSRITIAGKRKG